MLYLAIHLPLLPLEVFTRGQPQDKACAVVQQQGIAFANQQALNAGIQLNSSLSTALALKPELRTFERKPQTEQQQGLNLAHRMYRFSPAVSYDQSQSTHHVLLIEISGSIKLFKSLQNILNAISEEIIQLGYSFTMGLAHTPKAASLLALGSRLASRPPPYEQAPDRHSSLSALRQLPLELLQTDPRPIEKLQKMGLQRLGQLLDLPEQSIGKRFGQAFLQYLQKLTGERADPLPIIKPREYFSSQLFFLEPIENSQMLLFPMQRLLDEFCHFLRERQLHSNRFSWRLYQGGNNGKHSQLDVQLSQAQANKSNFLQLSRIQLEKLCLQQGVHTLELEARQFVNAAACNQSLFLPEQAEQHEALGSVLDKLQARLGAEALRSLSSQPEHLPEYASTSTRPALKPGRVADAASSPYKIRPAWLLQQPLRLQERNEKLFWRGRLELLQGPERIESRWWDAPQQRDYYIAQHEDGSLYWLYQDIPSRSWYVQGIFA